MYMKDPGAYLLICECVRAEHALQAVGNARVVLDAIAFAVRWQIDATLALMAPAIHGFRSFQGLQNCPPLCCPRLLLNCYAPQTCLGSCCYLLQAARAVLQAALALQDGLGGLCRLPRWPQLEGPPSP